MNAGLWLLCLIAICDSFNISDQSSRQYRVRNKRNDPRTSSIMKIRYHHHNQTKLAVLKKVSDSTLAGLDTPIWFIEDGTLSTERTIFSRNSYVPIFYHGVNSFSAVTYSPRTQTLHGILNQEVYIENLPLINVHNPEDVNPFIHPIPHEMSYLQNFRNIRSLDKKRKLDEEPETSSRKRLREDDETKILYPEIFLTVDVSSKRIGQTRENKYNEAIMYIFAYWNAIDMLFRNLKYVNMKLNIAAILMLEKQDLSESGLVLQQNIRGSDTHMFISKLPAMDDFGRYFLHTEIIQRDSYDFLIWMTSATLVDGDVRYIETGDLHSMKKGAAVPSDCGGLHHDEIQNRKLSNYAVVMYDDEYSQYHTVARELAHLMFIFDDDVEVVHNHHRSNCLPNRPTVQSTGIMDPSNKRIGDYLLWSYCSEIHVKRYSSSKSSCCLLNYPYRTLDLGPRFIQYTTIKSQCECYGKRPHHAMYYRRNICAEALKCQDDKGRSVAVAMPLDGTPCLANGQEQVSFCRYQECL